VNLEPPSGSRISVTTDGLNALVVIPHGGGGVMRYFVGLFVLAWLGAWAAISGTVVGRMLSSGSLPCLLGRGRDPYRGHGGVLGLSGSSPLRAGIAEADAEQRDIRLRSSPISIGFLVRIVRA
jgi:hypothetical protein